MYVKKLRKSSILITILFMVVFGSIQPFFTPNSKNLFNNLENVENNIYKQLKNSNSWILSSMVIDDSGYGDYTWDQAVLEPWCNGSGTKNFPYIIENVTIKDGFPNICLEIQNSNKFFIIRNCTFVDSRIGIKLYIVENGRLISNNCSYNNQYGIRLAVNTKNIIVSGNILNNNSISAYLAGGNITIYNNTIKDTGGNGISVNNAGNNYNITKNKLYRNGRFIDATGNAGIEVYLSHNCKIINNLIVNSGDEGIEFKDTDINYIINNTIQGSGSQGIYIDGGNFQTIVNNSIQESGSNGIFIEPGDNHIISNNTIVKSGENGIYLIGSINNNISSNTCSLSQKNGLYLDYCHYNNISKNVFFNNQEDGIYNVRSHDNQFWENTIKNNSIYGVHFTTASGVYSINNTFYRNKFITNNEHVFDGSSVSTTEINYWNYSTFGNYWDNYAGEDTNDDGIGDSPYDVNAYFVECLDYWPIWWDSPQIVINSPNVNNTFEASPSFNISIFRGIANSSWYTLDNGISNITFTGLNGTIDKKEWDRKGIGLVIITFYVNDSKGFINSAEVGVLKFYDIPQIEIISPSVNQVYGSIAPEFSISINDESPINNTWYTIDAGLTNYTFSGLTGTINQTAWDNKESGLMTIRFYANDSFGNLGFNDVSIEKDIILPKITINSPISNQLFGINAPTFSLAIDEPNLLQKWYSFNGGDNFTFTTENQFDQTEWGKIGNGTVLITFYVKDIVGNVNSSEVVVRKNTFVPEITIHSPFEDKIYRNTSPDFNISIIEDDLIISIWYKIEGIGTEFIITELVGSIDQDAWNNITQGEILITFYAEDNAGNIGFESVIIIKSIQSQPAISGYSIFLIISVFSVITVIILKKQK